MRSLEPAVALRFADMAEELAGVGYWWMDTATQTIRWSPNMYKIYGLAPGLVPSLDYAMRFVHPDDRIPIVAFTASSAVLDQEACRQCGFDAVLAKPVAARDLLSIVAHYTSASAQGWLT